MSKGCEYLLWSDDNARAELNVRVGELERAGVQDGGVWFIASLAADAAESRERRLRLAITGFQKSSYPRFLLFTVAANLGKTLAQLRSRRAGGDG